MIEDFVENEEHGGRRHVSEVAQDVPGETHLALGQGKVPLHIVEDLAPAGMGDPEADIRLLHPIALEQGV